MLSLISCRSDIFRRREPRSTNNQIMPQLLDATCTQENHQKTKEIPRVPRHNFLYSCSSCLQSCEFKALMAGVCALIDKDPLPHSGAQSVSRWLLWNSTAGGQCVESTNLTWPGEAASCQMGRVLAWLWLLETLQKPAPESSSSGEQNTRGGGNLYKTPRFLLDKDCKTCFISFIRIFFMRLFFLDGETINAWGPWGQHSCSCLNCISALLLEIAITLSLIHIWRCRRHG